MENITYRTVVLDAFGGDNAPTEIIKGAILAINEIKDLKIILTGNQDIIKEELSKYTFDEKQIEIVHATEIITNNEAPTTAIRTKKDSSLVVALDRLKQDENVLGLVSAGSTGAVLTGGFMKIGRIPGISRPALAPILPTQNGKEVLLIDCGANMDCKPINLCHFALMGKIYMESRGVENPRIALLSVGVEDEKGNDLVKRTFPLMKQLPINFVGNMEARDMLTGDYDVVVTDGFGGNVMLKSIEGSVKMVMSVLKTEIMSSFKSKLGALLMKKSFTNIKNELNYEKYGGSPFLGCKKVIIKSHGSSKAFSIYQSIKQVLSLDENKVYQKIESVVGENPIEIEE